MKPKQKIAARPRIDVPKEIFEPLSPYNWDFRTVPLSLLKDAIGSEYLRSWPQFRAAAIKWLEKKIDGRSIREHIIESVSNKLPFFPKRVWEALPQEWHYAFLSLYEDPTYPVPFTWLLEKGFVRERQREKNTTASFAIAPGVEVHFTEKELKVLLGRLVSIHPMNKARVDFVSKMLSFPNVGETYGYHLEINFDRHRNEDIKRAFALWLEEEAKKARKIPVHGKASQAKWHRLKQLAAKRFSDAGLNYKAAQTIIADRERATPMEDKNQVLPKYNSAGAWHDAIKEANLMVEKMKQNFNYEDWELL